MLQSNHPLEQQRERRVRERRSRRAVRALRRRVGSLRRLLAVTAAVALICLGAAIYFAIGPDGSPSSAVLLGRGTAGVMDKVPSDSLTEAPSDSDDAPHALQPAGAGEASYYGDELRGRPTASGEAFNPEGFTAAHRSLPLGSRLRVTNVKNGESVVVRVNDRGPFSGNRIIDLSKGAARELGMLGSGTTQVRLELVRS